MEKSKSKSPVSAKGSATAPKVTATAPKVTAKAPSKVNSTVTKKSNQKDLDKLCADEISIPADFPGILKAYTKAAIRTQPANLLIWSISYFRCMENGIPPPVKDKIEPGPAAAEGKLTVGFLQILHKQLGMKKTVTYDDILRKWRGICQDENQLSNLFISSKIDKQNAVDWNRILPLLTTLIGKNMNEYMTMVCKVFSSRRKYLMNWEEFWQMYITLSQALKTGAATDAVKQYLEPLAKNNNGLIGPPDFNDPACPKL